MTKRKNPEDKVKVGRPTLYSKEIAELVCERVATHTEGTKRLCEMYDDMPDEESIRTWRFKHPEFAGKYLEAKRTQSELLAESIDEILNERHVYIDDKGNERIDTGAVARAVAIANGRKWIAARLAPRIYGERTISEVTVVKHEDVLKELE